MNHMLSVKTAKFTSLENLYEYGTFALLYDVFITSSHISQL